MKLTKLAQSSLLLGASITLCATATHAWAQTDNLQQALKTSSEINQSAAKSQRKIDRISEQIQTKLQQFKAINKETDGLKIYNAQMKKQISNQLQELSDLAQSMEQVSVIERQISPLMARMIDTLAEFVSLDVPFLPEERKNRINNLKAMMDRADVAVSEKFRRVLEAYQVEMDYGRTIEAYSGLLTLDGKPQDVEFLRVGRIALIYETRDGSQLGRWDQQQKSWQTLDSKYRLDINKGLRIARKQLAPDLMVVPVEQPKVVAN